ncbi:MAG TPA: hypothetical protein VNN18_08250 [Candidatus Xenobia bacterium]|nr:hypothetical protein [Candidatus Xenobia bacterium]
MQVEFFSELDERADRLEIPWASPDDPRNLYYDLKTRPELLSEVVEARDNLALRQFLAVVNAPETMFATAKCHTWLTEEFSPAERDSFPSSSIKFAAYVDLVFSLPAFNFRREHYDRLCAQLERRLAPVPAAARLELCLRHCYYHAQQAWGFYLTAFLYGYGASADEARHNWSAALKTLGDTLAHLSKLLRQALAQASPP